MAWFLWGAKRQTVPSKSDTVYGRDRSNGFTEIRREAAPRKSRSSQWARTRTFRLREGRKSAWANEPPNRRLKDSAPELNPPESQIPRYLLRDRDKIFGADFRQQVAGLKVKEVLAAPRSPWQRAYVERVTGSIRRECLDHVIVFSEASLRRTLASYFSYYHETRPHLSLAKDLPKPRPLQPLELGPLVASLRSGGCTIVMNDAPRESWILGTPERIARGSLCAFRISRPLTRTILCASEPFQSRLCGPPLPPNNILNFFEDFARQLPR